MLADGLAVAPVGGDLSHDAGDASLEFGEKFGSVFGAGIGDCVFDESGQFVAKEVGDRGEDLIELSAACLS